MHLMSFPLREAETLAPQTFKHPENTGETSGTSRRQTLNQSGSFHGKVTLVNNLLVVKMQSRSKQNKLSLDGWCR